ncbi:MAG: hypothetical protein CMM47_07900 [Rhodospirillaceae bacterium]|nr:hypothetical protein [Rhodospirillaceae bacterium]
MKLPDRTRYTLAAAIFATALATSASLVEAANPDPFSDDQKNTLNRLIRDYIIQHPEVIMKSLQAMQEREQLAKDRQRASRIVALSDAIKHDPNDPVIGNPDGNVTLVEFFDYQCGYCKRMLEPLINFARADGNIRIVLKEYPILGPESIVAARASLAAQKQGKYEVFHTALMGIRGRLSEATIFQAALEVGLDPQKLQKDMIQPDVLGQIQKTRELGRALSIHGTPAFVIDDRIIPGAIGPEQLKELVENARSNG